MTTRNFALIVSWALTIAMALAAAATQGALAQCTPNRDCPEPGEREKKPTATDVPRPTPTDTPTPVPPPACLPPDADQLIALCAGLIPPPADPALPIPGAGDGELTDTGIPTPGPPESWPLLLLGGGVFIGGLLIGRLLPAVQTPFSWGRKPAGEAHPPEPGFESLKQKVSPFQKMQDGGEDSFKNFKDDGSHKVIPKVESELGYMKMNEGAFQKGFPKVESQESFDKFDFDKFGDEGSQKVFPKVEGQSDYAKLTGDSAHKVSPGDEGADLGEGGLDTLDLKQ
jgi:hypothetical protein